MLYSFLLLAGSLIWTLIQFIGPFEDNSLGN